MLHHSNGKQRQSLPTTLTSIIDVVSNSLNLVLKISSLCKDAIESLRILVIELPIIDLVSLEAPDITE